LVLDEKNDNEEGCFWKEGYAGKVALILGRLASRGDSSMD
jgi:hypothetical protein